MLISLGYSEKAVNRVAKDPFRLISRYFGVARRLITLRRRKIHKSRGFACPEQHLGALAEIESLIKTGDNLSRYLSNAITELKNVDTLLNGWGVHHLHLGDRVDSKKRKNKGFMKRTNPLLLCYFTKEYAYLLDVMVDHDSFESQSVLDIMHENWPHLLDEFRMPDITLYPELSREDAYKLMNSGYMLFVAAQDGTAYMPPGGGVVSSRENASDTIMACRLLNDLNYMQEDIIRFLKTDSSALTHESPIKLRLCVDRGKYCVRNLDNDDVYEVPEPGVVVQMKGAWGW